jgi:hypothetical protein
MNRNRFQNLSNDDLEREIHDRESVVALLESKGWSYVRSSLERELTRLLQEIKTVSPLEKPTVIIAAQSAIRILDKILATPDIVFAYLQDLLAEKEARVIKKDKENSLYLKIHNLT